ncbi:hypothetical protein N9Y92_01705 [Chlamydiales bacterium]|nr:hypothetical protein [Chlamydiales bacterium]
MKLDGTYNASLKWKIPPFAEGEKILWTLDLGLDRLQFPLKDQAQFSGLKLSVNHFFDLIPEEHILGVILYQGDLFDTFEKRNQMADYLDLLMESVPKNIPLHLEFNPGTKHPIRNRQFASQEVFHRFIVKGETDSKNAPLGVLLPPKEETRLEIYEELEKFVENQAPYRMIYESELINMWHGLDHLIIHPETITTEGLRMVKGFLAAGGELTRV